MAPQDSIRPPDFRATLSFVPSVAGGRHGPAYGRDGKYRPAIDFGDRDVKGCICDVVESDWVAPGGRVTARIWFIFPDPERQLALGQTFQVLEGLRHVANGRVVDAGPAKLATDEYSPPNRR
jgi:translation elongation factor EF-Tu-like GTPase